MTKSLALGYWMSGMMAWTGFSEPLSVNGNASSQEDSQLADHLIVLKVDATEIGRKIIHSKSEIPVHPGMMTLYYPKWLPGEHGPNGPIDNVVNFHILANGQALRWRRDLVDPYLIHCNVPQDVKQLNVSFDYLIPVGDVNFSSGHSSSPQLGIINWNQVVYYPSGFNADHWTVKASLKLPANWQFGTALPIDNAGNPTEFKLVSLVTLIDSPVVAGEHYRRISLDQNSPTNEIDIVADTENALALGDDKIAQYRKLVSEAKALFGAAHYEHYHFLVALSDVIFHSGIEHHESSLNTIPEKAFTDEEIFVGEAELLPHEFVHSWNGKYRRPASLTTPNYQEPMIDDMLWIYEGLTEYLGSLLLTTRSGLSDAEHTRDFLAATAAAMNERSGRTWRSLQDTADDAARLYMAPDQWEDQRRSVDFYPEGVLLWLETDTVIRQQTHGVKSIDDFCHLFHGGPSGAPTVKTYNFDEVITTLNRVAPYDWEKFWLDRLNSLSAHAPLHGIEASGWRLVYNRKPNAFIASRNKAKKRIGTEFSLGLLMSEDGGVIDILKGSPADKAGMTPGMKVIGINSRVFNPDRLNEAIASSEGDTGHSIDLLVCVDDFYKTYSLDYHDGLRYPHLERIENSTDLLSKITEARASHSE
jgi:predicted metalloprotease with PDZ domain